MSGHNDDTEAIRGIEELNAKWAPLFNAKRIDELAETFYADDAVAIPPGQDHCATRGAIRELLQGFVDSGKLAFDLGVIETHANGGVGYLIGSYTFTDSTGADPIVNTGRTLEIYRQEPDGQWKCVADMWHHID